MRHFVTTALSVCIMLMLNSSAQQRQIQLGYAHIQTVGASPVAGGDQRMVPGIVVRIFPKRGSGEMFALSNRDAVVLVPLRPGQYCFEAFDRKGVALALEPGQASCFPITVDRTTEVGVVVRDR